MTLLDLLGLGARKGKLEEAIKKAEESRDHVLETPYRYVTYDLGCEGQVVVLEVSPAGRRSKSPSPAKGSCSGA